MKITTEPRHVWDEYQKGRSYKEAIDLFENVRLNENFYLGKQWEGLNAPDLPKPVLNFMKRVVTYIVATITSDDVAVSFSPHESDEQKDVIAKAIGKQLEKVMEITKYKTLLRRCVKNMAIDGDACQYFRFDPTIETGQTAKGDIAIETIDNINITFGNPYDRDVQTQPYIIIMQRKTVADLREEAERYGVSEEDALSIRADSDQYQNEKGDEDLLATKLIKFWKRDGAVWCTVTCETLTLRKPYDTGLKLYPVAWMNWDEVKSSYHGQAVITGLMPNQIEVNRLFACFIRSVQMNAFPKIVYDSTKIASWSDKAGTAIKTNGGVSSIADAVTSIRGGDTSNQVMEVIDKIITMTRDFMGANDAALGNIKPDNTSAIIAVQQASSMPLDLQRMNLYQFVEDGARIMVDIMRACYGTRTVTLDDPVIQTAIDPMTQETIQQEIISIPYDFGQYDSINYELNVDVGASSNWSELIQTKTMDNLFASGILTDAVLYLESIPAKYLRNKDKIIASVKERQEMMQQQMAMQQAAQMAPPQEEMLAQTETGPDKLVRDVAAARNVIMDKQRAKGA